MLFRRVKQHVVDENWFAVFVDFVIVVAGVYVGIQVSNWNIEQQEEVRAVGYLERLRGDLVADQVNMRERGAFWDIVSVHGTAALAYAESDELANGSAWETVLSFYQASQMAPYVSINTTYEELRNSGELNLIRDSELQAAFADYYISGVGNQAKYLLQHIPKYRETIRGLTPWKVQLHIWDNCHSTRSLKSQILMACDAPLSEAEAAKLLDVFMADQYTIGELRFWMANQRVTGDILDTNLERVDIIVALVDQKLAAKQTN